MTQPVFWIFFPLMNNLMSYFIFTCFFVVHIFLLKLLCVEFQISDFGTTQCTNSHMTLFDDIEVDHWSPDKIIKVIYSIQTM